MGIEGMPLALLVNPSSGGRQGAEAAAAGSSRRSTPRRVDFRVERTKSLEHGVEQALRAVEAGEIPVVISGDGLVGAVGGAMAGAETPLGIIPGGRGNDLARVLGIPDEPEEAVDVARSPARPARIDVGEANGKRFLGIVSVGFDSEANRLANETSVMRGNLVYAYAALRTLLGWKPARFTVRVDDERDPLHRLLGLGRQQQRLRRRHVHRPRRRARRRPVRRRRGRRGRQAALPG